MSHASISDDGRWVAFESSGDLEESGQNADGNDEIYVIDTTTPDPPVQITFSVGGSHPAPQMSGNGSRIVFDSEAEFGDLADNGDGSNEIWLYDPATGPAGITQLTNSLDDSSEPTINADGTRIAFRSDADHTGENPDGSDEIFLHDTDTATTTQMTDGDGAVGGDSVHPLIDRSGTRVAFVSQANLTGDDPDGGRDLFLVDTTAGTTTQLIDTDDSGIEPTSFDGSATLLAFMSTLDHTGGNPGGNDEIFLHDIDTATTTQITSGGGLSSYVPILDAAGDRMVFESFADLTGENPTGNPEMFVLDRVGRVGLDQLTSDQAGNIGSPDLSADGTRIAVPWRGDPEGENPDNNQEIFLFICGAAGPTFTDVPATNVFYDQIQWMSAAEIASGFPNGTFKPQDPVKRQQMANFLYNLAGQPAFTPPATPTFNDVPTTNAFYAQVEWMVDQGIASGFPGGLFKPQDPVKRQQMANFLHNLAGQPAFTPPVSPTFTDVPTTNPFYAQIEWMVDQDIASGFPGGLFKPQDPVKRQQMANFLLNLVNGPGVHLGEP